MSPAIFGSESEAKSAMGSSVEVDFGVVLSIGMSFIFVVLTVGIYKRRIFGDAANKNKIYRT